MSFAATCLLLQGCLWVHRRGCLGAVPLPRCALEPDQACVHLAQRTASPDTVVLRPVPLPQYENLTSDARTTRAALRDLKRFVGVTPRLPSDDLGLHNSRRDNYVSSGGAAAAGGAGASGCEPMPAASAPMPHLAADVQAEGWPMTRREYSALVDLARADAEE